MSISVSATTCSYCYLDLDLDGHRRKLATAAAFVDATDSRYGFSSKDLRLLGGSEAKRIPELISLDHDWSSSDTECGGIATRPPEAGNRIVLKLFWDVAPLACENFATLCSNGSLLPGQSGKPKPAPIGESGKPLTYKESRVHRVIPGFVLQGGDFVFGNGSGGESVFGKKSFKDERGGLKLKHDRRGILSMGNSGKNSNSSQFFLTLGKAPQCDGKHVVFGELVSGMEILEACEKLGTQEGEPTAPIDITNCGIYEPLHSPACGYWYDCPDPDKPSGVSPVFMSKPRVAVVAPTTAALSKFKAVLGTSVSLVAEIATEDLAESACLENISSMLKEFRTDVVIVAPSCKYDMSSTQLPDEFQKVVSEYSEVVIEAKPVEALTKVHNHSWLGKRENWTMAYTFWSY